MIERARVVRAQVQRGTTALAVRDDTERRQVCLQRVLRQQLRELIVRAIGVRIEELELRLREICGRPNRTR